MRGFIRQKFDGLLSQISVTESCLSLPLSSCCFPPFAVAFRDWLIALLLTLLVGLVESLRAIALALHFMKVALMFFWTEDAYCCAFNNRQ